MCLGIIKESGTEDIRAYCCEQWREVYGKYKLAGTIGEDTDTEGDGVKPVYRAVWVDAE